MRGEYTIDTTHQVVHLAGPIPAALKDWCATLDAVFEDPVYTPGYGFLSDRRGATMPPPDAYILDAIRYLQTHRPQLQGCHWALVTDSEAMDAWAHAVVLLGWSSGIRFRVFHEVQAAERWLMEEAAR
jgi:hypothetical protein